MFGNLNGKSWLWRFATALLLLVLVLGTGACDSDGDDGKKSGDDGGGDDSTGDDDDGGDDDGGDDSSTEIGCSLEDGSALVTVAENQICFVLADDEEAVYESGADGEAFYAVLNTTDAATTIATVMDDGFTTPNVELVVGGSTAGDYSFGGGSADFNYYIGNNYLDWESLYIVDDSSACDGEEGDPDIEITITEFGAVGEQVTGTFEGQLVEYTYTPDHEVLCDAPIAISGAFSVERGADESD